MTEKGELGELLREQRVLVAALKTTSKALKRKAELTRVSVLPSLRHVLLLTMAEALISAHKAAKFDDDGHTLDLIEDALRHVGERLAKETSDGRDFRQKRLAPYEP